MSYLTWLDVQRVVRTKTENNTKLPSGVKRILTYSDGVEVVLEPAADEAKVLSIIGEWFKGWFSEEPLGVILDIEEFVLPIYLNENDPFESVSEHKPLWEDIAYLSNGEQSTESNHSNIRKPTPLKGKPYIVAFHSFKGGVGRTTALTSFVASTVEDATNNKLKKKILVIDADLEAPGITYWLEMSSKSEVSFISFLEAVHYPVTTVKDSIDFVANELKKTSISYSEAEVFFLPACISESQLLDTPVLPEHLSRSSDTAWKCIDVVNDLGVALEADYIFIDLRAGLSEISSPFLFDPRVEKFIVSTITSQSIKGLAFILNKINQFNNKYSWVTDFPYRNPSVILTMLTKELMESKTYERAISAIEESFISNDNQEGGDDIIGVDLCESLFSTAYMTMSDWNDAIEKLRTSDTFSYALEWVKDKNREIKFVNSEAEVPDKTSNTDDVRLLLKACSTYEYAEKGESENLLITEPIRNLAKHNFDKLPCAVSVGAKGAGKTFNYLQLSSAKTWKSFLSLVKDDLYSNAIDSYIFPFLQSANLETKALEIVNDARDGFLSNFEPKIKFSASALREKIEDLTQKNAGWSKLDWSGHWVKQMSATCGVDFSEIDELNDYLESRDLNVIYLFDGIEDTFKNISHNACEQNAVSALLDIPNKLLELRKRNLGVVIFLREDYLKAVVKQNAGQFMSRYSQYYLSWDAEYFLKLVYWTCIEAKILGAKKSDLDHLGQSEILTNLEKLWDRKLGGVKEANSASWVYAALTDLKGRLQARDIIRFLKFAATNAIEQPSTKIRDVLLPPSAIRSALAPCSVQKVKEAEQEYPLFGKWVENLNHVEPQNKVIPFDPKMLEIDPETLDMLKEIGVVFEDKDKEEKARYYVPEIYRAGLGFRLEKGARPRVLVLQKRAVGNNLT